MRFSSFCVPATLFVVWVAGTAHADFSANLIVNPGAEDCVLVDPKRLDATADFPGWARTGNVFRNRYTSYPVVFPVQADPVDFGIGYFLGGNEERTSLTQSIALPVSDLEAIDAGDVTYTLKGFLGASRQQAIPENVDRSELTATFLDASGKVLGTSSTLASPDRKELEGLGSPMGNGVPIHTVLREDTGPVPAGTRSIRLDLTFTRSIGFILNASADDLSMVLSVEPNRRP